MQKKQQKNAFTKHNLLPSPSMRKSSPSKAAHANKRRKPAPLSMSLSAVVQRIDGLAKDTALQSKCLAAVNNMGRLKGTRFSPDGSCILTLSDSDAFVRLFEVKSNKLVPSLWVKETSVAAYDAVWFPLMHSSKPETCAFATLAKNTPVHLWDAYSNNALRASYTGMLQGEPLLGAVSLALSESMVFAGCKNSIHTWDITRPGSTLRCISVVKNEISGIVSTLDASARNTIVAGTYSGHVLFMDLRSNSKYFAFDAQQSGVSRVRVKDSILFAGGRRSEEVLAWDVRVNSQEPLFRIPRKALTNQRIDFDVLGSMLATGSSQVPGEVEFWSFGEEQPKKVDSIKTCSRGLVNGVSFDPTFSYGLQVAVSTGCRPRIDIADSDGEQDDLVTDKLSRESSLSLWEVNVV